MVLKKNDCRLKFVTDFLFVNPNNATGLDIRLDINDIEGLLFFLLKKILTINYNIYK